MRARANMAVEGCGKPQPVIVGGALPADLDKGLHAGNTLGPGEK